MAKIGKNDPCPCGSGKKYKKCCALKKPRKKTILVRTDEPIKGFHYDKDRMMFSGITEDDRIIDAHTAYSQTFYKSSSGKERVINRIPGKVIPDTNDLFKHLSTFDMVVVVDTNTKILGDENLSAAGIVLLVVQRTDIQNKYKVFVKEPDSPVFRNCPSDLHPEKLVWMMTINQILETAANIGKSFAIVTDHDCGNHIYFSQKTKSIYKEYYLPENFTFIYSRSDGSKENILNETIKKCDKKATEILDMFERDGFIMQKNTRIDISQIPIPDLKNFEANA